MKGGTGKRKEPYGTERTYPAVPVDVHADDYALSLHTSRELLNCMKAGRLKSISIVPNMDCFKECMELLKKEADVLPFFPAWSVHLNLVEGKSLSGKEKTPALSDSRGCLHKSWEAVWLGNYMPGRRKRLKNQLKEEIRAQIDCLWKEPSYAWLKKRKGPDGSVQNGLRIDGHQHTQMIPVVRDALCEVLKEGRYPVAYIRLSAEPLAPFFREPALYRTYRPVNLLKNLLLNSYRRGAEKAFSAVLTEETASKEPEKMYLWGLLMSGRMDRGRVERLYPHMLRKAARDGRSLEILFHPGRMRREEAGAVSPSAVPFYLSPERQQEYATVMEAECLGPVKE